MTGNATSLVEIIEYLGVGLRGIFLNTVSPACLREFELYLKMFLFCRGEEQNIRKYFLLLES